MSEPDDPFARFASSKEIRAIRAAEREVAWEESLVEFLLNVCKAGVRVKSYLRRRYTEETGRPAALTFAVFNREFPDFPLLLGAYRPDAALHTDPRAFLPALFRRFQDAPFVAAYDAFIETHGGRANGRAVGLVFPRKGVNHGLIIHDGSALAESVRGMIIVYQGGSKRARRRLYVQPFQSLVEAVRAAGWRPGDIA